MSWDDKFQPPTSRLPVPPSAGPTREEMIAAIVAASPSLQAAEAAQAQRLAEYRQKQSEERVTTAFSAEKLPEEGLTQLVNRVDEQLRDATQGKLSQLLVGQVVSPERAAAFVDHGLLAKADIDRLRGMKDKIAASDGKPGLMDDETLKFLHDTPKFVHSLFQHLEAVDVYIPAYVAGRSGYAASHHSGGSFFFQRPLEKSLLGIGELSESGNIQSFKALVEPELKERGLLPKAPEVTRRTWRDRLGLRGNNREIER